MSKVNIYKLFFEQAEEPMILLNSKSLDIIDLNRRAKKLLGITQSKSGKYKLSDFFPEDNRKQTQISFNKIKRKKTGFLEKFNLQNLKGQRIEAEIKTIKVRNVNNDFVICVINTNGKIHNVIKQSETKFKTLFESANDAIMLSNGDTFIDCNKKSLEIFDCTRNDIVNERVYKFSPTTQPDGKNSKNEASKKNKAALAGKPQFFEWQYKKPDGTLFNAEVSLNRIVMEEQTILQGIVRDITDKTTKELTIREQSRRMNTLLSNLPGMVYRCRLNRKWTMEFVSQGCFTVTGYKAEDFINDSKLAYSDIINPEDRDRVWIEINYAIEKKKPFTILYRIKNRNGFEKWVWEKGRGIFNEAGELVALEGFIIDITDRKIAEEKISILAHALKSISECVWITDMNEVITFVNSSFCKTYGYEQDEIIGEKISIIRPRSNSDELLYKIRALTVEKGWTGELLNITKLGKEFPALLSTSVIKDDSENPVALIGIVNDITERKKAEEALKQSEERFKSLVDNMLEPAIILNMQGSIIFANNSVADLVETSSPEDATGKNIFEFLHPDFNRPLKRAFVKARKDPDLFSAEFKILTSTNNEKWVEGLGKKITFENTVSILITLHDISERKIVEEKLKEAKDYAEEMNRLKTTFLANMSHELRTPLVGILGYSEMLLEKSTDPEHQQMIERILYSGTRLMDTLNSVLDLSRIEANRIDVHLEPVNVPVVIKRHVELFKPTAEKRGLYIRTICSDKNIIARLDERFLGQIINNLVNNAIKFTKEGGITIKIDMVRESSEKLVKISVSDTGIGIPPENIDKIFEEFRQVSEGFSRHFEGTGLGLTITKRFIDLMDGKINVKSELGAGSEFIISFTALDDTAKSDVRKGSEKSEDAFTTGSVLQSSLPEVLFVEDDQLSRDVTKAFLEDVCWLTFATNGEDAIEEVKQKKFDAILMDINLGRGMSGIEATEKIRQINGYKETPIVAITAFAMAGDKDKFIDSGCTHYISKPYDRNSITQLMQELFTEQTVQ